MKCVICKGTGSEVPGEICLQSTPHGSVCRPCVYQLVGDVIQMRKPWDKTNRCFTGKEWKRLEMAESE